MMTVVGSWISAFSL